MPRKSQVPEGRTIFNTHVDEKLHRDVRYVAIDRKIHLTTVADEALRLWLRAQRR
jgi:hypothetical protein